VGPALIPLFGKLWEAYAEEGRVGRTVTVKLKYADFQRITRSRSVADPIASRAALEQISLDLLRPQFPPRLGVRLLGVTVANFAMGPRAEDAQFSLSLL
jgi:DNA polymerase-4